VDTGNYIKDKHNMETTATYNNNNNNNNSDINSANLEEDANVTHVFSRNMSRDKP
jgi:hypothetical protein